MNGTSFFVGTNLDGIFVAKKNLGDFVVTKLGKFFSKEKGVIKTASANVLRDGGERNNFSVCWSLRKNCIEKLGKRFCERANRGEFKIVDEFAN